MPFYYFETCSRKHAHTQKKWHTPTYCFYDSFLELSLFVLVNSFAACCGCVVKSAELVVHAELQMPEESVKHLQHGGAWNTQSADGIQTTLSFHVYTWGHLEHILRQCFHNRRTNKNPRFDSNLHIQTYTQCTMGFICISQHDWLVYVMMQQHLPLP